jgi:hypothetical protein
MKQFDIFLEGRATYIKYLSKNKSGKVTDDPVKVTKIEAEIPAAQGTTEYHTLAEIAELIKEQKALTVKLDKAKEEARLYMEELFDISDKLKTRVLKINLIGSQAELLVSLNKDTERKTVDYKGFFSELKSMYSDLSADFDLLLEKYTSISQVASAIKFDLNESVGSMLRKLVSYFSKRLKKYDKFIAKWS